MNEQPDYFDRKFAQIRKVFTEPGEPGSTAATVRRILTEVFDDGEDRGFDSGYADGMSDGAQEGYDEGYAAGFEAGDERDRSG